METLTISKKKEINAPKEKVWKVLTDDKASREWLAEFSEGTYAESDWKEGSSITFIDKSNSGMVGRVIVYKPGKELTFEYDGFIIDGKEDYESEGAKAVKGGRESYYLSEQNGVTTLSIDSGMSAEYFDTMSNAWDKALDNIKMQAEK